MAFDSCHIPTLIKKLAAKGVGSKLLRVIIDMYLNAESCFDINGSTGETFRPTTGVAQGCVLSPIFFNVYVDDLLASFRQRGIGIQLGSLTLNSLSFADDLTIASVDVNMAKIFLDILSDWSSNNNLLINMRKSGFLRVGTQDGPPPDLQFNGQNLRCLDDELNENEPVKYLGFKIPRSGSWDTHILSSIQKACGVIGQFFPFFQSNQIPIDLKLSVARSMILSRVTYGSDIFSLNASLTSKLEALK